VHEIVSAELLPTGISDISVILGSVVNDRLSDCFADQILSYQREMKAVILQDHGLWKVCEQADTINKDHILRSRM
jgi:hypothetical protein